MSTGVALHEAALVGSEVRLRRADGFAECVAHRSDGLQKTIRPRRSLEVTSEALGEGGKKE